MSRPEYHVPTTGEKVGTSEEKPTIVPDVSGEVPSSAHTDQGKADYGREDRDSLYSYGRWINDSTGTVVAWPLAHDLGPLAKSWDLKPGWSSPLWFIPESKRQSAFNNGGKPRLVVEGGRAIVVFEFRVKDQTHDADTGLPIRAAISKAEGSR